MWKLLRPNASKYQNYVKNIGVRTYPRIASIDETILELLNYNKSIARFGDGEFMLCFNRSINFQRRNLKLQKRLRSILKNKNANCLIGLPSYDLKTFTPFWYQFWFENTRAITKLLDKNTRYYNQGISRSVNLVQINKLTELWRHRAVIFVFGKNSRFNYNHEIFNKVKQKYIIESLAKNAWQEYDHVFKSIVDMSKKVNNPLVICSLGPTATVLAYDLSIKNIQTLDLGHLTNIYDSLKYGGKKPEELPTESNFINK